MEEVLTGRSCRPTARRRGQQKQQWSAAVSSSSYSCRVTHTCAMDAQAPASRFIPQNSTRDEPPCPCACLFQDKTALICLSQLRLLLRDIQAGHLGPDCSPGPVCDGLWPPLAEAQACGGAALQQQRHTARWRVGGGVWGWWWGVVTERSMCLCVCRTRE